MQNGSLAEVLVEDTSRKDVALTILAPYGNLSIDSLKSDIVMLLQDGTIYSEKDNKITKLQFKEYVIRFALSSLFKGLDLGAIQPKEMSWKDLSAFDLDKVAEQRIDLAQKIHIEMHKRWLFPFSCLVLTIFAVPIATSFEKVCIDNLDYY